MQEIRAWLENQDYSTGVALYEKYGTSDFLKQLFAGGSSQYTKSKLWEELASLVPEDVSQLDQSPAETGASKIDHEKVITSPVYLKLCRDRDQVFRQIDRNMYLLDTCRSDDTRYKAAKQILRLQRRKQEIFAELDYIEEHGAPMPVAPPKEHKTPEMQRLYVQICKAEKRLLQPNLRNREKTTHLLARKRARLEELRRERSGL